MPRTILLFLLLSTFNIVNAQPLTVASYNIRYNNPDDAKKGNGWKDRFPIITQLVLFNDFDIWGAQEVLHDQLNDLLTMSTNYTSIGVGRDDGKTKGEYAPIFFKTNRLELLKDGHFWLSENCLYPNKGWDAALPRICTWGQFRDINNNKVFWFFNLHMDHVGVIARQQSAKLLLKKIEEMCGDEPFIITGDFNVDQTNESYSLLVDSGLLIDTYEAATICYAPNGTFNAWDTNLKTDSRIDHVFVSKHFKVNKYGILTDTYRAKKDSSVTLQKGDFPKEVSFKDYEAKLPSDHFPVKVILEIY